LPDEVRQDPSYFRAAGQDGFRDGCRVPLPWTREGSSYGFGSGGSWLPQPAEWGGLSVEAQTGAAGSTLEFYRAALALRRAQPALGAGTEVTWLDAPEGVLALRREAAEGRPVVVTAHAGSAPVTVPSPGEALLSSGDTLPVADEAGNVVLAPDTTVWWLG
ncbi:DUF3459 domain-containing protein, partial [Streptomyces sp. SPB78]|uniref:DUF3459 domain-containing protein n=1 Tax=Streptomyces sp. (strain SPB78) TaxID=591157 RepID=UPI0001B564A1